MKSDGKLNGTPGLIGPRCARGIQFATITMELYRRHWI